MIFLLFFFFFNDTATTEIYTLSLHDALPISRRPASTRCTPVLYAAGPATSRQLTRETGAPGGQRHIHAGVLARSPVIPQMPNWVLHGYAVPSHQPGELWFVNYSVLKPYHICSPL